ncbi:MAG TPA: sigma-70 family RNA polymerase sigma factor [Gaiellaceae bacterium]|nr:sigma-70 family RNA polymerase sigma factor [Gaiellaceae bacterium]
MQVVEQRTWTNDDLAALFDRFFPALYDVAVRVLGSQEDAGAAVGRAFARASAELSRRQVDDIRPWLYGLLAAELPHRRRAPPIQDGFAELDLDRLTGADALAQRPDVALGVWRAASALPVGDYILLDLQLRHGLRDSELGHALQIDVRSIERRLDQARDLLEAVEAPIPPVAVFAALAPVAPPSEVREQVWKALTAGPAPKEARTRPAFAVPWKPILIAATIALLAAAAAAGAFYAASGSRVHDPTSVRSTSHSTEHGSADPDVEVTWDPSPDASGYSTSWSAEPETPDETVDLPGTATGTTGHLKPGTSWFNLRTRGTNGHWTNTVHLGPFLILPDTVVPETTITSGPKRYGTAKATFEFSASERATLQCSLDGAAFAACVSPKSYPHLNRGRHSFRVRAVDAAGNIDPTPAQRKWQVDTKPPETALLNAPDEYAQAEARFTFKSSEAHSTFECKLDQSKYEPCRSGKTYRSLEDGPHRFHVRAVDRAGNPDSSPPRRRWVVDTKPPETAFTSGPADPSHKATGTFALASESSATFECKLDGHAWGGCNGVSALRDGKHVYRARARDRAGNVDPTPAEWRWRVDLPPETSIAAGPSGPVSAKSATFRFSSSDSHATFQCRLDGGKWTPCASGRSYSGLGQGEHTFRVRAKDAGGTVDPSPASRSWSVDTAAPNTTITSGPKASTGSRSATFSFSSSESGVSFQCRLDGGSWQPCSSPRSYGGLKKGAHVFRVRAIDAAGNVDSSPDAWSWTIH